MIQDVVTKSQDIKSQAEPKKISHSLLEDIIDGQELILKQLEKLNVNVAIIGKALITMNEGKQKAVKK